MAEDGTPGRPPRERSKADQKPVVERRKLGRVVEA